MENPTTVITLEEQYTHEGAEFQYLTETHLLLSIRPLPHYHLFPSSILHIHTDWS